MNLLDLGDLHANWNWPHSEMEPNGYPSRLNHLFSCLDQAAIAITQLGVTDLILGGDLLHRRHFLTWRLYNPLYRKLEMLAGLARQTIIFPGNHDYEDLGGEHGLYSLRGLPNTMVVDTAGIVALSSGEDVAIIPFQDDPEAMVRAFDAAPAGLPVFSHYAAAGCPLNSDYWLDAPLKLGELARFDRVFFNHVHKPGEQLDGKVVYVGAPLQFDFGDGDGEPRGGVRYCDGVVERVPFLAPVFRTATWPRVPAPPPHEASRSGYLRILGVPEGKLVEAQEAARKLGWLGAVADPAPLPQETREALSSGLLVSEALIAEHVRQRCPDLSVEEQNLLIEEGVSAWNEARG